VGHLTYVALLVGCLVVTAPLEVVLRVRVYARWRRLLLALLPELVVFLVWEAYAISRHHWGYDPRQVLPVRIGGMPLEELLFFLVVPVCAVLALEAVRKVTGWDAGYPPDDEA
jgi:lycopene cyclase domain-containing protein